MITFTSKTLMYVESFLDICIIAKLRITIIMQFMFPPLNMFATLHNYVLSFTSLNKTQSSSVLDFFRTEIGFNIVRRGFECHAIMT